MPLPSLISRSKSTATAQQPQPREALPENTPLEFRMVLSACRLFLRTEEPAALEALLKQGPDWDRLISLSNRHGVMPLLYRSLSRVDRELVPQEAAARLRAMYMQNAARNIRMTGELLRILDAFKDAGIKAVPLKGPVLAEQLYGDVALRQFSDLDILVTRDNAERAFDILSRKGYKWLKELSKTKRLSLYRNIHHYELVNKNNGIIVEIHWGISPNHYRHHVDVYSIINNADNMAIMGKNVLNIANEDLLLLLCQHGTKHVWEKLSWINDVAKVVLNNDINWPSAHQKAIKVNNEKQFIIGLFLAKDLMKISNPPYVLGRTKKTAELENYSEDIIRLISFEDRNNMHNRKLRGQLINWHMFNNPLDKARFIYGLTTTPTMDDSFALSLPDNLFEIYNFTKPIRIVISYRKAICSNIINRVFYKKI